MIEKLEFPGDGEAGLLVGLSTVNIILGRNGAGKSRLLRFVDSAFNRDPRYRMSYVSPERSGSFQRDGNVDTTALSNPGWTSDVRRTNQPQNTSFKAMSHLALRNAERSYLRNLQNTDARGRSFQADCLDPMSRLLSNVSIEQGDDDFVFKSHSGAIVQPSQLSSGESETIALASEVLSFLMAVDSSKINILLLDEPDVHQHPDLQARFGYYLLERLDALQEAQLNSVTICIASHSTALICALAGSKLTTIGTKEFQKNTVEFSQVSEDLKKVSPFFGHPLSLSLSNDPIVILEGPDDERVWQQAARSSQGRIRVFPVLAQSVDQQYELEAFCDRMLSAIYDTPKAFSIRDGDGKTGDLDAVGCVARYRLRCYAIENLLVSDECLQKIGLDWSSFQDRARAWISINHGHKDVALLQSLVDAQDRLVATKIKDIRDLIVAIAGVSKPWEVVLGQTIASLVGSEIPVDTNFSIFGFLGDRLTIDLIGARKPG